jgi:competence protein ComGC
MSVRYQFIKNPKVTVYETPAEAYLIIEGTSQTYKVSKETRKRNIDSLSCQHCAMHKQRKCYQTNEQNNEQT